MARPTPITPDDFPWFDYSGYSFSLGLLIGDTAQLSGHSASRYDRGAGRIVVEGDMADQARTAYAKVERILAAAGFGLDEVVHIVENVTIDGIDHYVEAERVRAEVFGANRPAVNTVVVHQLLRPKAWIEVEVTASRSPGQTYAIDSSGRAAFAPARRTDGVVYLSTIHPLNDDGEVASEGDPEEQVRQIFRNADRLLAACGLDMSHVVKTLEMIKPDALVDYKSTGRVRGEFLGPVFPGAAGIIQKRVAQDDRILISYDFIASIHQPEAINPGWDRYRKLTYSPAVRAGNMLFMSGQAALDPETETAVHSGDIAAQADYTYSNIITVLEAAGMRPDDLIKTVEYVTPSGLPRYREVAAVRRQRLRSPWPASTGALCHSLLRPEFQIEIDPTAMVFERDA
jgi:enamine deaminase RidA (YjgF/YER057c/UK114 family)